MGELWRKASDLFWKRPLLWLPVLAADLLGFAANQGQMAIMRAYLLRHMVYHSAIGGAVQRVPLDQVMRQTETTAITLAWASNFLKILLYVVALVITAELVRRMQARRENEPLGKVLLARLGGILAVAVLALAVNAAAAVAFGWITRSLVAHGHGAVLQSHWFNAACFAVLMVLVALVVAGPGLRLVAGGTLSAATERHGRVMAVLLVLASFALGLFVGQSGRAIVGAPPGRRIVLEALASLLTAVPFILMFIGFGVLAVDEDNARVAAAEA